MQKLGSCRRANGWLSIIREKLNNEWPIGVREAAGSWDDFPFAEEIRGEVHADTEREPL